MANDLVPVAVGLLYMTAGFLLAPWLQGRSERFASVDAGTMPVNAFLLILEVRDVRIKIRHGRPLIASEQPFVDRGDVPISHLHFLMGPANPLCHRIQTMGAVLPTLSSCMHAITARD